MSNTGGLADSYRKPAHRDFCSNLLARTGARLTEHGIGYTRAHEEGLRSEQEREWQAGYLSQGVADGRELQGRP